MKIELDPASMHHLAGRYRGAGGHVAEIGVRTAQRAASSDLLTAEIFTAVWHRRFVEDDLVRAAARLEGSFVALAVVDATEIDAAALAVLASQGVEAAWDLGGDMVAFGVSTAQAAWHAAQWVPATADRIFGATPPKTLGSYQEGGKVIASKELELEVKVTVDVGGMAKVKVIRETIVVDGRTITRVRLIGEVAAVASLGVGIGGILAASVGGSSGGTFESVWDFADERSANQLLARLALNAGAAQVPVLGPGVNLALRALRVTGHDWGAIPLPNSQSVGRKVGVEAGAEAVGNGAGIEGTFEQKVTHQGSHNEVTTSLKAAIDGSVSLAWWGIPTMVAGSAELSLSMTQPLGGALPRLSVQVETIGTTGAGPGTGIVHGGATHLTKDTYHFDLDLGQLPDSQAARHLKDAVANHDAAGVKRAIGELQQEGVIEWGHDRFEGTSTSGGVDLDAKLIGDVGVAVDGSVTDWKRVQ